MHINVSLSESEREIDREIERERGREREIERENESTCASSTAVLVSSRDPAPAAGIKRRKHSCHAHVHSVALDRRCTSMQSSFRVYTY